ncbi:transposase [Verrucosispora sp. ts21]|uniref:polymorphic toxin type 50 domain-containing protein n=1 Tax=Verrucosispora sp. ts21 TaxID=2069341 RepID=UPI000C88B3A0|nr:transposase [Verrucosispora sp. ts21]
MHPGKQGKHVPGHNNFDPTRGRSEFTHSDPQGLINQFAGTGVRHGNKEVVDFRQHIGTWVGIDGTRLSTTRGTIHYGKDDVHIVPAHPTGRP